MRVLLFLLLSAASAPAAVTYSQLFTVNTVIPDNQIGGLLNTQTITTEITSITAVNVTLNMSGGWNGDLYVYLAHDSGFTVLLNRIGSTSGDIFGSGSSGFSVTFGDDWDDVHTGAFDDGTPVSGFFSPDARNVSPFSVTDASNRTAFLSSFTGLNGGGTWELFLADVSGGDVTTLNSWGLEISGIAEDPPEDPPETPTNNTNGSIPEPSVIVPFAALFVVALSRRQRPACS
jgi:subtilisin-like proprotein convertase family protein